MNELSFAIRSVGMILVVVCSTGIGLSIASAMKSRARELETAISLAQAIEAELTYKLSPPGQAVAELARREAFSRAKYLSDCAKRCADGEPFPTAWRQSLADSGGALDCGDRETLRELADVLGQSDLDGQKAALSHVRAALSPRLEQARQEQLTQGKLCKQLGFLIGCAIVIVAF